jgi:RNA polymerase sigma-70 factor (ECF subfamily)
VRRWGGARCQVGDSDDFDGFFAHHFPLLVGFLCKRGFDLEVAQDASSEAMLSVYEQWTSVTFPAAWVRSVAARKAAAQVVRGRDGVARAIRSDWACSDEFAEDKLLALVEDSSLVVTLLERLPERQRSAMAWHLDGFSNAEIARHLDVREATVRSTVRHARERLKQIYQEMPEEST